MVRLFVIPLIYLPGSSVHGIFQARIREWVAISSPGDLPNSGINPRSPALQTDALPSKSYLGCNITLLTVQMYQLSTLRILLVGTMPP